jgi:hypothetical protein
VKIKICYECEKNKGTLGAIYGCDDELCQECMAEGNCPYRMSIPKDKDIFIGACERHGGEK